MSIVQTISVFSVWIDFCYMYGCITRKKFQTFVSKKTIFTFSILFILNGVLHGRSYRPFFFWECRNSNLHFRPIHGEEKATVAFALCLIEKCWLKRDRSNVKVLIYITKKRWKLDVPLKVWKRPNSITFCKKSKKQDIESNFVKILILNHEF